MEEKKIKIDRSLVYGGMVNSACFGLLTMLQAVLMFSQGQTLAVILSAVASYVSIRDATRFYDVYKEKQEE